MWFRREKKMRVVTLGENGKEPGDERWVRIPKPESFRFDGFDRIEGYVSRLLRASAPFTSLIIAAPNKQVAVDLWQRSGIPGCTLFVDWRAEPERERAIRQFFAQRELSPSQDYLGGNGNVPDAIRLLAYHLPPDVQFITGLTKDVLRQVHQLRAQDGLDFTYQQHHDAV
jgi:hypothetical protein